MAASQHRMAARIGQRWTMGRFSGEFGPELAMWNDEVQRASHVPFTTVRAAHPHGRFARGRFVATGAVGSLTKAAHLQRGVETPVLARLSNFQRPLEQPDVMGFAVKLLPPGAAASDLVALSSPRFLVDSIEGFRIFGEIIVTPKRRLRRQAFLWRRLLANGASLGALAWIARSQRMGPYRFTRPLPGRARTTYHGVHTFVFVDSSGNATPFRYRWMPQPGNADFDPARPFTGPATVLRFSLLVDCLDPTWKYLSSAVHVPGPDVVVRTLTAGDLTLDEWPDEQPDHLLFNPTRLPVGIEASDDEILFARASVYPISHRRRNEARIPPPDPNADSSADPSGGASGGANGGGCG